jgi:cellulose synthase/poly-beta-1,6-N-acetylglucosamine synthase-like glycosyltransferase
MWTLLLTLIEILYALSIIGLAIYGFYSLGLVLLYLKAKRRQPVDAQRIENLAVWPRVTVQLPIFNERYTVERLLDAVTKLDYPRDRLQIQVLDDSTDLTTQLVRSLVTRYRAHGLDVQLIHRTRRDGFKAGALAEGLKCATGELIAIFDADFMPGFDWLRRTVPEFRDSRLGCLQTRWGYLNHDHNLLTRLQALGLDGHFVVEQTARSRNGLFLNFNGTAGMWRKTAIDDAGGWSADTLTEDFDLSYRAQLRGWRVGYLPEVVVPAELPTQIDAFRQQQFRWAKGSTQTMRKVAPLVWRANLPWHVRLAALVHLAGYTTQPQMLLLLMLSLPIEYWAGGIHRYLAWAGVAAIGLPILYSLSKTEYVPRLRDRLIILPFLLLLGYGLSLNNSIAVLQGLIGNGGEFIRTPKYSLGDRRNRQEHSAVAAGRQWTGWGELVLTCYALGVIVLSWPKDGWAAVPWMLSYAAGYLFIVGLNIRQSRQLGHSRKRLPEPADNSTMPM